MTTFDNTIDPDETGVIKVFDWSSRLATGETIASFTATGTDVTVDSSSNDDTTVTVKLSAATGTTCEVLCRVTTSLGQVLDATMVLFVVNH